MVSGNSKKRTRVCPLLASPRQNALEELEYQRRGHDTSSPSICDMQMKVGEARNKLLMSESHETKVKHYLKFL